MEKPKYFNGKRIKLAELGNIPEQRATIVERTGCGVWLVQVVKEDRLHDDPDGLVEAIEEDFIDQSW